MPNEHKRDDKLSDLTKPASALAEEPEGDAPEAAPKPQTNAEIEAAYLGLAHPGERARTKEEFDRRANLRRRGRRN